MQHPKVERSSHQSKVHYTSDMIVPLTSERV